MRRDLSWKGCAVLDVQTEHVLVVPTERFCELGYFQGFCPDVDRYLKLRAM